MVGFTAAFKNKQIPKLEAVTIGKPDGSGSVSAYISEDMRELLEGDEYAAPTLESVIGQLLDDNENFGHEDALLIARYLEVMSISYGCNKFATRER